ncbi:MAG: geranylgeranyl diphosphate reductase [Parvularculaceae bacterium]|nr:geranylgeranyl diphosphate reductase [Parvularculaceae bacterium]
MSDLEVFDCVVVGGGPAGATAAHDLALQGRKVMLLDKAGRIKPCGGAIPPRLIRDFDIPDSQIVARAQSARMISPAGEEVDMPINGGCVGMVDREHFDEWLRVRAASAGAVRIKANFEKISRAADGTAIVEYTEKHADGSRTPGKVLARTIIGADGARSKVGQQEIGDGEHLPCVFAYHEIISSPAANENQKFEGDRCDIYYQGQLSPDFYAWIFPHGETTSVGVGSAQKGFSLRGAVAELRGEADLDGQQTIREEGAPIPLKPRKKWDNGKDVMLAGDAAGCVAPASGEGIYYAMLGGRVAAEAMQELLETGDAKAMARARKRYMREHGKVFFILGMMQHFWYRNDKRRERFVNICRDKDVQHLTWEAYMNKRLVRSNPLAHVRIFLLDMAHLLGIKSARS